jgi:hypothetical protein
MLWHTSPSASSHGGPPHSENRGAFSDGAFGHALRIVWSALREGLAAHRAYQLLRSRRIPHDAALTVALGRDDPARTVRLPPSLHAGEGGTDAQPFPLPREPRIGNLAFVP